MAAVSAIEEENQALVKFIEIYAEFSSKKYTIPDEFLIRYNTWLLTQKFGCLPISDGNHLTRRINRLCKVEPKLKEKMQLSVLTTTPTQGRIRCYHGFSLRKTGPVLEISLPIKEEIKDSIDTTKSPPSTPSTPPTPSSESSYSRITGIWRAITGVITPTPTPTAASSTPAPPAPPPARPAPSKVISAPSAIKPTPTPPPPRPTESSLTIISNVRCHVYIISDRSKKGYAKVGIHVGNIEKLHTRYRTSIPELIIHCFTQLDSKPAALRLEKMVKDKFVDFVVLHESGLKSEWFKVPVHMMVEFVYMGKPAV